VVVTGRNFGVHELDPDTDLRDPKVSMADQEIASHKGANFRQAKPSCRGTAKLQTGFGTIDETPLCGQLRRFQLNGQ
jgi:hypothetical protein